MKKNVAGQNIGVQMLTAADGTVFTGAVSVAVTVDSGTQTAGAATAPAHKGNGYHSYAPTQGETNGDHIALTFTGTGAIATTLQVYTQFPQAGDSFPLIGTPAGGTLSAALAAVKVDSAAVLVDTSTTLPATLADLASQASVDTIDAIADAILADTVAIQGGSFNSSTDSLEAIRNRGDASWTTGAGGSSPTVAEIRAEIDSNSTQLAAILVDTGTTLPARFSGIEGTSFVSSTDSLEALRNRGDAEWTTGAGGSSPTVAEIRAEIDSNSSQLAAILSDTGTSLPSTLAGLASQASVNAIDVVVDSILVDTGTSLPATLASLNDISVAQVNAEVLDVLVTDTFAEVSVPAATASLKDMIHYTYSKSRNKITQTDTLFTLRNDSDNGDLSTAVVELSNATTTTKGADS
jgi:hypothetical protein